MIVGPSKGGRTAFEDPESPAAIRPAESEIYHRGYLVFIVRGRNKSKNRSSLTSEEGAEGKQKNGEEKLFCPLLRTMSSYVDQGTRAIETRYGSKRGSNRKLAWADSFFERSSLAMAVAHRMYRKTGGYGFDLVFIVRLRSGSFRNETGHFTTLFILATARNAVGYQKTVFHFYPRRDQSGKVHANAISD